MLAKQISIFIENKSGRLYEVTGVLKDNDINISALSIADTTDFGILRIVVDKPEQAESVLRDNGFAVSITDVIAIRIDHIPGGLNSALKVLQDGEVSVEYMYAFTGKASNSAFVIVKVNDVEKAMNVLTKSDIELLETSEIYL